MKEVQRNRKTFVKLHSHLYATDGTMIGTFQRIDIPMLKELDMYNYVLFTGELRRLEVGVTLVGKGLRRPGWASSCLQPLNFCWCRL